MPAKPTAMQAKAMELIREGKSPRSAMIAAGYSPEVARSPGRELLGTPGAKSLIEQYMAEYAAVGITPKYLATKTAEWLQAKKTTNAAILVMKDGSLVKAEEQGLIEVDDYQTQLKAAEMVRKDFGMGQELSLTQTNIEMNLEFVTNESQTT